ncbi:uncharacterized protein LOC126843633 [Adelges cooleyi]|uniref:uncharacterized protein LOC126843633 n=1 Tax=Adelges cooleyi TaxID=133065 RepID=UPI00217F3A21|nr:uncharacterized protein LOC126843633 [Adelges cooleyi]
MKTSYGFLPDKQVMGMTYTALGIPTVCGEPSKRFLKAHKKFKVYYPTKRPSKLRKRPIAILKNKYYANKKQRRKTTTNGPKKVSNSPGQVVENQPKVSINGNDSTSCCFGEQTHLDTTLPPLANDDHQDTSWTSPEQSPLIFISRDPNSCVDDNNNSSNSWMDHHEMVTPKLEKHTPKDQLLHLDHSYCSVETVKLTRWQKLQTQDSDSDSDEPLGLVRTFW